MCILNVCIAGTFPVYSRPCGSVFFSQCNFPATNCNSLELKQITIPAVSKIDCLYDTSFEESRTVIEDKQNYYVDSMETFKSGLIGRNLMALINLVSS